MLYKDRIYGKVKISEPVILELIKSRAIQRLKGIDQIGYFKSYFPGTAHSRFEHSLGVFILLKKFGASLEEQVAGLIHDVSHSVFSHCIDYALDEGSEKEHSHQDNVFESFIRNSSIPSILAKHEMDVEYILNDNNFPLKEKPLPDLCADRIDYSLREAIISGEIKKEDVNYFLNNLSAESSRWIFNNFKTAQQYAELFSKLNSIYWAGMPSAIMFRTVGDCIRYALQKNYITKNDIYTTDKQVLEKIKRNLKNDKKLKLLFDRMNNKIKAVNDPNNYDAHVFCKSRIVDPLCRHNGRILLVSQIDKSWAAVVKKESKPKEYFLKFEE